MHKYVCHLKIKTPQIIVIYFKFWVFRGRRKRRFINTRSKLPMKFKFKLHHLYRPLCYFCKSFPLSTSQLGKLQGPTKSEYDTYD